MGCLELLSAADILLRLAQMDGERYVILRANNQLVEEVIRDQNLPYKTIGWDAVGKSTLVERNQTLEQIK